MIDITVQELKQKMESNTPFCLIDVREVHEFEEQNLGGTLIPLAELPNRISEIEHLKNSEIWVHCRSGKRSETAKKYLLSQGFTNVRNVLGGILAWNEL